MNLENYIRDVPDFPKRGIVFKDITPLLGDFRALQQCASDLLRLVGSESIDKVVGMESRGFFFGSILATRLDAGFVPVRKKGKLPYKVVSKTYDLEYGVDALELHVDAIQSGDRVLIHDDVLATGGTAAAVVDMVESLGGTVVQCNFMIELGLLKGRDKLNAPITSLITY